MKPLSPRVFPVCGRPADCPGVLGGLCECGGLLAGPVPPDRPDRKGPGPLHPTQTDPHDSQKAALRTLQVWTLTQFFSVSFF